MKGICTAVVVGLVGSSLLMGGCGPDQELVASALVHRCNMEKAVEAAKAATEPNDKIKFTKEATEARGLFDAVLASGDAEAIRTAVANQKCP